MFNHSAVKKILSGGAFFKFIDIAILHTFFLHCIHKLIFNIAEWLFYNF